ncbi:MAG: hypothetical protein QG604_378 [Candidatus Dependentiae bacterium]|nr:hypothetical protein [Candidatus Dependentiae bacterium]
MKTLIIIFSLIGYSIVGLQGIDAERPEVISLTEKYRSEKYRFSAIKEQTAAMATPLYVKYTRAADQKIGFKESEDTFLFLARSYERPDEVVYIRVQDNGEGDAAFREVTIERPLYDSAGRYDRVVVSKEYSGAHTKVIAQEPPLPPSGKPSSYYTRLTGTGGEFYIPVFVKDTGPQFEAHLCGRNFPIDNHILITERGEEVQVLSSTELILLAKKGPKVASKQALLIQGVKSLKSKFSGVAIINEDTNTVSLYTLDETPKLDQPLLEIPQSHLTTLPTEISGLGSLALLATFSAGIATGVMAIIKAGELEAIHDVIKTLQHAQKPLPKELVAEQQRLKNSRNGLGAAGIASLLLTAYLMYKEAYFKKNFSIEEALAIK